MRLNRYVSALTAVAVLAVPAMAQGQNDNNKNSSPNPDQSPTPASPAPADSSASAAKSPSDAASANSDSKASPSPSPSPSKNNSPSDSPTPSAKNTPPSSQQSKSSSSSTSTPTPTPTPTPAAAPTPSSPTPSILSPSSPVPAFGFDIPTGLPTLTGQFAIPTYPPASVPPTKNAPFMQQSSAPSGTVFIAVGAILGAFAIGLLIWRTTVSFLLHRSVDRAAMAQHDANSKAGFPAPPAPFYKDADRSSPSAAAARSARRTSRGPGIPSASPSASNLFFSPTAAGSGAGQRGSAFLPSGFYNAGTSTPGGGHGPSISLTNLRPESMAQNNASRITLDRTPPDSPHFAARRDMSSTSLTSRQPGQRAPSAYLEDLLADDPSSLPPPQMPPQLSPGNRGSGRF